MKGQIEFSAMWILFFCFTLSSAAMRNIALKDLGEIHAKIPDFLQECYNGSYITTKDNLYPMTMTTLISLIRKLEDSREMNMGMVQLGPSISSRFRFDGIERNPMIERTEYVIPYSPVGTEFYLYKILFERLMPKPSLIPNDTLNYFERCTLHSMLSLSVDKWDRGDNDAPCGKIQNSNKYSSHQGWDWGGVRFPRDLSKMRDVEVFEPDLQSVNGRRVYFPQDDHGDFQQMSHDINFPKTACPLENGVIYDRYGSVAAGIVLAGIATGLNPENVSVSNLLRVQPRSGYSRSGALGRTDTRPSPRSGGGGGYNPRGYDYGNRGDPDDDGPVRGRGGPGGGRGGARGGGGFFFQKNLIDNIFVSTLSGVLAEVALLLGPQMDQAIKIGLNGGWNDTSIPKYYFLKDTIEHALTDARIRGSIDGLILGKQIKRWSDSSSIKLSQILGMYYSERGLFGTNVKACKRRDYFDDVAPDGDLKDQTYAFAEVLQDNLPESVNIKEEGMIQYVDYATEALRHYIPMLPDPTCPLDSKAYSPTIASDIAVVVDFSWDYKDISRILTYLVDNAEINRYSSNFTVVNAKDGSQVIGTIQNPLDFYSNFTANLYRSVAVGFDFQRVLSQLKVMFQIKMQWEKRTQSGGGNSRVILFIPSMSSNIADKETSLRQLNYFRSVLPDVKLFYLVTGAKERFAPFAEEEKDVFIISTSDISQTVDPVIKRIANVPKRLINPNCGLLWAGSGYNPVTLRGYLEQNEVHYYRVSPNYFFKDASVKINVRNDDNQVTLTVCSSRNNKTLMSNSSRSSEELTCHHLTSGNSKDFQVSSNDCQTSRAIECHPFYISVAPVQSASILFNLPCTEDDCKYPTMVKYSITHQGLTCYSGVSALLATPVILSFLLINFFIR